MAQVYTRPRAWWPVAANIRNQIAGEEEPLSDGQVFPTRAERKADSINAIVLSSCLGAEMNRSVTKLGQCTQPY
jgi:hypothetical protein